LAGVPPVDVTLALLLTVWLLPVAEIVSVCGPGQMYGKFIVPLSGS
jgi:hypothetical protein